MDKTFAVLLVVFMSFISVAGDYFLKLAGNGEKYIDFKSFSIGFLIFALAAVGWFYVFKHIKFSSAGILYGVSVTLLMVAVGVSYFDERLNTYEIVGIISGIFSIILLVRFA